MNAFGSLLRLCLVIATTIMFGGCTKMLNEPFNIPKGVRQPWRAATEQEVQEIERRFRHPLPDDYRQFLLTVNGIDARPVELLVTTKERDIVDIEWLYTACAEADELYCLPTCQVRHEFDTRVPERFLLFGRAGGPEGYCMSLSGSDRGRIFYWCPPDGDDERTERWLHPIADSFHEFWSKLRVEREGGPR